MITEAWRIATRQGHQALLCLLCLRWSYHPEDIAHKYCGGCGVYLDTIPHDMPGPAPGEDPRAWVQAQEQANWQRRLGRVRWRHERIFPRLFSQGPEGT